MAGPNQECQAAFLAAREETGTWIRGTNEARIGRQVLASGWPFSDTSRARTLGLCGGVQILVSDNLEGEAPRADEGEQ